MNKIIKSLSFLAIVYVLISLSLFIFDGWQLKDAINFVTLSEHGLLLLAFFVVVALISVKISDKDGLMINLIGYLLLPFVYSVIFIFLFMKANTSASSCLEGMGCGLQLVVAIVFAIIQFVLLVINYAISRRK